MTNTPFPENERRLLSIHAHPDDEASKGASTIAAYHDEGVYCALVCCTGGEEGDILNPAMDRPEIVENLPQVRLEELKKSAEIIDFSEKDPTFNSNIDKYHFAEEIKEEETLSIHDKELELIKKALERNNGKRKAAAIELGISERTLYRKIKQHDIEL